MRLLIFGSRSIKYTPEQVHLDVEYFAQHIGISSDEPLEIISGGAVGIDTYAEQFADSCKLASKKIFYPDWDKNGKAAGIIRNRQMVEYCDFALGYWDGVSKGTKSTIDFLRKSGKYYIINTNEFNWEVKWKLLIP
jgi:hypothetical protein